MARSRARGNRFRWLKGLFALSLTLFFVWCAGLFVFAGKVPLSVSDPEKHTDVIVVLTGGSGRLRAGLDLLLAGRADHLFVSGVYRGIEVDQLLAINKQRPGEVENRISIGNAIDTIENAAETAAWMHAQGHTSLRLVTAAYHMPRSMLEFHNAMPEIHIEPNPIFPKHVKRKNWWAWPGTTALLASEFNKFVLAWLRIKIGPLIAAYTANGEPA